MSARRTVVAGLAALLAVAGLAPAGARAADKVVSADFTVTSSLDGVTLEARYYRPAAPGSYPVVLAPHGGGGTVDSEAPRAQHYASLGFVGVVWSARGHGNSGGFYDLFGPKTVQDTEDVLQWVISHRGQTAADPQRVGAVGYSQGGGTTNLIGMRDPRVHVLAPGQTFAGLSESLHPQGCMKLSVDSAILGAAYTAQRARLDPDLLARWSLYLTAGQGGDTVEREWALRSPRTYAARTLQPTLWVQAFDDPLFPVDQAVTMQRLRARSDVRLWLSWGGHFAAASTQRELDAREGAWTGWLQAFLQGKRTAALALPRVTWWYRAADGTTLVRRSSPSWPPPGVRAQRVPLGAGTIAAAGRGVADDPVVEFGERSAPGGEQVGQVLGGLPPHSPADTLVTTGAPLPRRAIVAGAPVATVRWSSSSTDSQLVAKLYDVAPDGTASLLSRGCAVLHATPGVVRTVRLALSHTAVEVPAGHRFQLWVQGADAPTWLPLAQASLDTVAPGSSVSVPLLDR